MNAPLQHPPPIGSPVELRAFAADTFDIAARCAWRARDLAEAGDDLGLEMTTRVLIAAVKAAAATVKDLRGCDESR